MSHRYTEKGIATENDDRCIHRKPVTEQCERCEQMSKDPRYQPKKTG